MKSSFKFIALLMALLMTITAFVSVALAEGEDSAPQTEETSSSTEGTESSGGDTESSSGDTESSGDPETSGGDTESSVPEIDPNAFFVDIIVEGASANAVKVTLNGEAASGKYTGTVSPLSIVVEANAGYKVTSATFEYGYANGPLVELDGKFSGTTLNLAAGATFTLRIVAELVPVPATLKVETMGVTGYTLFVNGAEASLADAQLMTGDEIRLDFAVDGEFVASDATLTVNGEAKTVDGLSLTLKLTGDTTVVFTYKVVPVTVTLEGPGKLEFQLTADGTYVADVVNNAVGTVNKTIFLSKDVSHKILVTPALGYALSGGVEISEPRRDELNGVYYFIPSGATTVKATMKASGGSLPNTNCTVQINVGMGGSVIAGEQTVLGGMGTNIVLKSGGSITFTVIPDEGYTLDVFRVGGVAAILEGNTYTLSNIVASSTNVSVVFKSDKQPENPDDIIGVADIDWSAAQITVDISGGKFVERAVLDKIATLSGAGKYVEFKSENGTVYFPYGATAEGSASAVDLSVTPLTSGALYDIINDAINFASGGTASYKAYSFNFGITAPEGTLVSFKLGSEYIGSSAIMLLYNSATSSFYTKESASEPLATLSDGTSGKYAYDNEGIVVLSKEAIGGITIEATVTTEGGAINPAGVATVYKGGYKTYYVTAQDGYKIKALLVDGAEIADAVGQKIYSYTFEDIRENHTISVAFEVDESAGGEDDSSGGLTTVIVILIIVLVALGGAAALFIVKWRQEKF